MKFSALSILAVSLSLNVDHNQVLALVPQNDVVGQTSPSRRTFLTIGTSVFGSAMLFPSVSNAIPMVTTTEFESILRDSARSIQRVEFSGPKNEAITVKLVDGTAFGIKDIVESPTDPRSPLKIAAICRENSVPTKFVDYEAILANAPKRKKMYTNARVQEAAAKERERQARIEQDEADRLAALYKMEEEAAAAAASSNTR